ncbi:hypothetical protein D3C75_993860 [compost metagenome]
MAGHILRQRETQHLFDAADQQGDALLNLAAIIAFLTFPTVAAVQPIFKNGA